jgi:prepilin-type N-terminal cleavage/methylation domain-containing protein
MVRPEPLSNVGRSRARRGFTLVELVMVVLLMGALIMAVFTVGYFTMRDTEDLKSQARALAGFLESVRTNAAVKGRSYAVEYNLNEQYYFAWIPPTSEAEAPVSSEDETRQAGAYISLPSRYTSANRREFSVWIERISFPDGGSDSSGSVKVEFTPQGGSHWHYIYLRNVRDEYYTIEVNPFTGLAEVFPGELKPEPPERLK